MKMELTEVDVLEVSDDTPMYNPHRIPFNPDYKDMSYRFV